MWWLGLFLCAVLFTRHVVMSGMVNCMFAMCLVAFYTKANITMCRIVCRYVQSCKFFVDGVGELDIFLSSLCCMVLVNLMYSFHLCVVWCW